MAGRVTMDEQAKRKALRMIPSGLFVVGVRSAKVVKPSDDLNAFIGSWVTQCSFKPPLVCMGVRRGTRSHAMIKESGVFVLNLLDEDQKEMAKVFFKDLQADGSRMGGVEYTTGVTGAPIFPELAAHVECEVAAFHEEGGDHDVVVGRVVGAGHRTESGRMLTTYSSGWHYGG